MAYYFEPAFMNAERHLALLTQRPWTGIRLDALRKKLQSISQKEILQIKCKVNFSRLSGPAPSHNYLQGRSPEGVVAASAGEFLRLPDSGRPAIAALLVLAVARPRRLQWMAPGVAPCPAVPGGAFFGRR